MTLIINIVTPEGIVMASDSRQTERNIKQFTRIFTNSANKLFSLNDRVIVGTSGLAFFADNSGIRKNISEYIEAFKKDNKLDSLTVNEISTKLQDYINSHYPWEKHRNCC
jgi:20S proteasome alpha/beta subunit